MDDFFRNVAEIYRNSKDIIEDFECKNNKA